MTTTTLPSTHQELAEVNEILADTLHQAWLGAHLARLDENRSARSSLAYHRTGEAKSALANVWEQLKLEGSIHEPRNPIS